MALSITLPPGTKDNIKPARIKDKKTTALMSISCTNVFPRRKGLFMSSKKFANFSVFLKQI